MNCYGCNLQNTRRKLVLDRGPAPADILFIGDAPDKIDELYGRAFTGKAGKFLEMLLRQAEELLDPRPNLSTHFTNLLACRPCNRQGGVGREPTEEEVLACWGRLQNTLKLVNPYYIVYVGKLAMNYGKGKIKLPYYELVHPTYLLKGGGEGHPDYLRTVRQFSDILNKWSQEKNNDAY